MTDCANVAATLHAHLCEHDWHGYTQGSGRWGDGEGYCTVNVDGRDYNLAQGDRDCSSSVIDCWQRALEGTAYEGALDGATYTGNMRSVFVGSGLFDWHPMGDGYVAQRGDIYLNEINHTAMCQSAEPDMLSEFLSNEWGGITGGAVGDQTGGESVIRAYWWPSFGWDGILAYNGKADDDMPSAEEIANAVWNHTTDSWNGPVRMCDRLTGVDYVVNKAADNFFNRTDDSGADFDTGADAYTRIVWIDKRAGEMSVTLAALTETVKTLAAANGADPDEIAQAVSDAVAEKLATIKLAVTTEDEATE